MLDSNTRYLIEQNESEFSALWAQRLRPYKCAELFINKDFPGDYFFNKTKILSPCSNAPLVIAETKRLYFANKLDCFVHCDDSHPYQGTNTALEEANFSFIDYMLIFSSSHIKQEVTESEPKYDTDPMQIVAVDQALLPVWVDVFCKAFDAENWKQRINTITRTSYRHFDLFLLLIRSDSAFIPAACALLFSNNNVTGLYCLGTLPEFRRNGLASTFLKFSILMARDKRMKFFFVQTFASGGFSKIYHNAGLNLIYKKRVYAFYRDKN